MLEAGIKGQHTIIVEKENTAAVMKSGTLADGKIRGRKRSLPTDRSYC